jgi:hypothetical protein
MTNDLPGANHRAVHVLIPNHNLAPHDLRARDESLSSTLNDLGFTRDESQIGHLQKKAMFDNTDDVI